MLINFEKFDGNHSAELSNKTLDYGNPFAFTNTLDIWFKYRREAFVKAKQSSLDIFKEKFGTQQKTVLYSKRNWVWTFTNDQKTATIYCLVSNEGVSWEFNTLTKNPSSLADLLMEIINAVIKDGMPKELKYNIQIFIPSDKESKVGQWQNTAWGSDDLKAATTTAAKIKNGNKMGITKVRIMETIMEFDCDNIGWPKSKE